MRYNIWQTINLSPIISIQNSLNTQIATKNINIFLPIHPIAIAIRVVSHIPFLNRLYNIILYIKWILANRPLEHSLNSMVGKLKTEILSFLFLFFLFSSLKPTNWVIAQFM